MPDVKRTILANADRLRAMEDAVHDACERARNGPRHHAACKVFHEHYDALAYPGGLTAGFDCLRRLDPAAVDTAIAFLEADPWFFRSGYMKEEIVRHLKRAPLNARQRARLSGVIIRSFRNGAGRVAGHLARLAPRVASPAFLAAVEAQAASVVPEPRRRARHVLVVLRSARGFAVRAKDRGFATE